jgi:hypothetical protein
MARGKKDQPLDQYTHGEQSVKRTKETVKLLHQEFKALGDTIKNAINNAVEAMDPLSSTTERIGKTWKQDIENSIKNSIRSTQKHADLQTKMLKGENVKKSIQSEIDKITGKRLALENKLQAVGLKKMNMTEEELASLEEALDVEEGILKKMLEKNKVNEGAKGLHLALGESMAKYADKIDETGTLSGILKGNMKEVFTTQNLTAAGTASMISFVINAITVISKLQTELNKTFGLSEEQAGKLRVHLAEAANDQNSIVVNSRDTQRVLSQVNKEFGTASTVIRKDILGAMARLENTTGLTAQAQARFTSYALSSGKHMETIVNETREAVHQAEREGGVRLRTNELLDEAGRITGIIAANLGYNVTAIADALAHTKQLGMEMKDLEGTSNKLLDFHSSIDAELQAELFTGKQLNLERARLFALTGDYKRLGDEINKNIVTESEYMQMNVLAKQQLAGALGMEVNRLSDIVFQNKTLKELAQDARDLNQDEQAEMYEKLDVQQNFQKLIEKMQMTFVELAEGPIGKFAAFLADALNSAGALYGILGTMAALRLAGVIGQLALMARHARAAGWGAGAANIAMKGIAGVAVAGIIVAGLAMLWRSISSKKEASFQGLQPGQVAQMISGEGKVHANEAVFTMQDISVLSDGIRTIAKNTDPGNSQQTNMTIAPDNWAWTQFDTSKTTHKIG